MKKKHQEGECYSWLAVGRERIKEIINQEISKEKMMSHYLGLFHLMTHRESG